MSLWVGTYAEQGGKGLHPLSLDGGGLAIGAPVPDIANASFGVWSRRHGTAYFVDEQEAGRVVAWRFVGGGWRSGSASGSGGSAPCFLALHPKAEFIAAANYADGSVALLSLDRDSGALREVVDLKRASGSGPDAERQHGPHAHGVQFSDDGAWLYHVDLGVDRVLAYPLHGGRLGEPEIAFEAPAGSGPRHLSLHPDGVQALLLCELSAELHLLRRQGPRLAPVQAEPTSPGGAGKNLGGHLALLGGGRVLVTNRGHDSLASFALERGRLRPEGAVATHGSSPRHFWTDGRLAVVAHETSGTVVSLPLPGAEGLIQVAEVPGAAFIMEIPD